MCYPCPRFVPELPPPVRLRQHRDHRPGPTPPSLSRRRLPHTLQKAALAARLAKTPQGRRASRDARAASQPPQRHRSGPTNTEGQARPAPAVALVVNSAGFLQRSKQGKGASNASPLAPHPHPPLPNCHRKENPSGTTLPILLLQAHSWIGKCCVHRADLWSQALEAVRTNPPPPGQVSPSGLSTPDTPLFI